MDLFKTLKEKEYLRGLNEGIERQRQSDEWLIHRTEAAARKEGYDAGLEEGKKENPKCSCEESLSLMEDIKELIFDNKDKYSGPQTVSIDGITESKVNIISDDLYYTAFFDTTKLNEAQIQDIKMLVNSEQYKSFRMFLQLLVLAQYKFATQTKDERTHNLNALGQMLENVIADLDQYREKKKELSEPDPYEV